MKAVMKNGRISHAHASCWISSSSQIPIFLRRRHIHEISQVARSDANEPLTEITSSGLTHSWEHFKGEPNAKRVGQVYTGTGFGMLHFNWSTEPITVTAEIRSIDNAVVRALELRIARPEN